MTPTGSGYNPKMAEYMGIYPTFATGCDAQGAAGVTMALQAAAYINAGLCDYVLCGMSAAIDGSRPRRPAGPGRTETATSEFSAPFGPTVGANGWYAMIAKRYEKLCGAAVKRAKIGVDLRCNAPRRCHGHGLPITVDDVVNSHVAVRFVWNAHACAGACVHRDPGGRRAGMP
jgi:acetyl-CoA acetyltransferase